MWTENTSASAEMFDQSSVQPPKRWSRRCAVARTLCSMDRLPVREQSRMAAGADVGVDDAAAAAVVAAGAGDDRLARRRRDARRLVHDRPFHAHVSIAPPDITLG